MNQPYFIVVLAHSLHGRIRRFHIDHKVVYAVLGLALLGCFTLFGFVSSYIRMAWKVSNYNSLRQETEFLRDRYQKLLDEANQTNDQLAKLQVFATEVSLAYGIRKDGEGRAVLADPASASLVPSYRETLEQYNMLRTAKISNFSRGFNRRWLVHIKPTAWPLLGRLLSHFGRREDPFSGRDAYHTGVDISAPVGSPVKATADGIVSMAEWFAGYGKCIIVDHGGGVTTYYAHLSRFDVIPGQEVRSGQVIGATGATGRVTTPHLHYEVRMGGNPVNPRAFMTTETAASPVRGGRDFGL